MPPKKPEITHIVIAVQIQIILFVLAQIQQNVKQTIYTESLAYLITK